MLDPDEHLGRGAHQVLLPAQVDQEAVADQALQEAGPYTLRLEIDRGTSPMEAGLSPDERQLGILVKTLTLAPLPAAAPSRSEGPEDGAKEVREDGPEDDGQTATTPEVA